MMLSQTQSHDVTPLDQATIDYVPCTLPFADDLFAGYPVAATEAVQTGLAYVHCVDAYTIVHLPTQRVLVLDWFVRSEQLARQWIETLVALADWKESVPRIYDADCLQELIQFACIGLLTEGQLGISCISSTVR
jgi:hypothetical protein